ncbi:hypothetical protein NL676_008742 [Syzygium grande]|nr:hypothetical protein NL676_008742 [Syzygium grande]
MKKTAQGRRSSQRAQVRLLTQSPNYPSLTNRSISRSSLTLHVPSSSVDRLTPRVTHDVATLTELIKGRPPPKVSPLKPSTPIRCQIRLQDQP